MSQNKPGLIVRLIRGIWNTLNFTRRLIFNAVFVILLFLLFAAFFRSAPIIGEHTALVLDPEGTIVEQYSTDPSERALGNLSGDSTREVQLRDLLRVIEAAAADRRIDRIVLIPDQFSAGISTLRELGQALDRFRKHGKDVVVFSEGMGQGQYYLAAHADEILLDPDGAVLLEGFSSYRSYYRDALDKLGVDVHLIKVGEYKSAAEPYILNHASDASKEADLFWMGGIWNEFLDEIAAMRKLDAGEIANDIGHLDTLVPQFDGDLAKLALDRGLVDQLATREQARELLKKKGVPDDDGESFRQVGWQRYLGMQLRDDLPDLRPQIGVVVAQGEIVQGEQAQGIGRREDHRAAAAPRTRGRADQGGRAARGFTGWRRLRLGNDPPRNRADPGCRQAGRRLDGRRRGQRWLLDLDECQRDLGATDHDHRIDRHLRPVRDDSADAGENRRAHRRRGDDADRRRIRHPAPVQSEGRDDHHQRDPEGLSGLHRQGRRGARQDRPSRSTRLRAAGCGAARRPRSADWSTSWAACRKRLPRPPHAPTSPQDFHARYVERELSAWERFALTLSNSEAAVSLGRWSGLSSLPRQLLGNAELERTLALLRNLGGNRYGVVAHCFCTLQ